jgi:MoaA/NifB/PqqE/SkfB family radical SAM enzyme
MNKKIPDFILLHGDDSILKAFLEGWENGDGYVKNGIFKGSTVSKTLAIQLQLAYASIGIFARINFVPKEKGKFYDRIVNYHNVYRIIYSKEQKLRYTRRIGNYLLHPIRKIEKVPYSGTVHNIETKDNTYLVSNAIVHNCNIWQIKPKGELTIDDIREFAKKNNYFKWVELTGGEPFLRGDIVEIAKAFKETSKDLYLITFPTNSLCDRKVVERRIREIMELGIPRIAVTISLDGYRELHDKIRGVPGNYDKAIEIYKYLLELKKEFKGLYPVFGYTMSKFNVGEFQKTYEEVKKAIPSIQVNDFHINLAQNSSSYYQNENDDITPDRESVVKELKWILANRQPEFGIIPTIESAFMKRLLAYAQSGVMPMKSRSLDASLFMDSFGNVYPSIMWDRKIGNIKDVGYDLSKLWHNPEAEKTREEIKAGKEPSCWTSCEAYQTLTGNILSLIS